MGTQLQSYNFPDRFIRHRNFQAELDRQVVGQGKDYSFVLMKRGKNLVGLRSVNFPDRYLRHKDFRLVLEAPNGAGDDLFKKDSTFYAEPGLADPAGVSFRSLNFPDRYLRHRDFHLWVEPNTGGVFPRDATFYKTTLID